MNKTSFGALLYREYVLSKKNAFMTIIASALIMLISLLISVSMKVGNLAHADDVIIREVFSNTRLLGIYASCFIMCISVEATMKDETSNIWKLFRKSTPVSPFKLSLAKFTLIFIFLLLSAAFAGVYLLADSAISGLPVAFSDITMLTLVLAVISLMIAVQVVCATLTGSTDKGGLMSIFIMAAVLIPAIKTIKGKLPADEGRSLSETLKSFSDMSVSIFPLVCIFIAAVFIIGFVVTALLYKRREK